VVLVVVVLVLVLLVLDVLVLDVLVLAVVVVVVAGAVVVGRLLGLADWSTISEWQRAEPAGTGPHTGWCWTPVLLALAAAAGDAPGLAPAVPTSRPITPTVVASEKVARATRERKTPRDLM
jgi:hypothetical protein